MRALLVVNPKATTTSVRVRDVLLRALGSDLKLEVGETTHRGHAASLAERAAVDGFDLVLALGGDGTVNEVVNGLMQVGGVGARPLLAVVPGGNANVFSRTLGQPADPVEATSRVLEALRTGRRTTISLGRADERYFTFCAGMGLDAEVVALVEQRRGNGATASPLLFARAGLQHYFGSRERRRQRLRVEVPDDEVLEPLAMAIVCNTAPWTYCGSRPLNPTPGCGFDTRLDLFAMRKLRATSTLRALGHMLATDPRGPRGRQVVRRHDVPRIVLTASMPLALQLDGEYVGVRDKVVIDDVPAALTVVA